ncbi:MAG: hypothetical protein WCJ30_26585, partial [Deltaproteobacteria bacterium]
MQPPETLRAAALDALGAHADARAVDMVERARITLIHAVRQWVASSGTVTAHIVQLEVGAHAMASLRAWPGLHDTLVAAFSTAIAHDGAEALASLEVYWGFEPANPSRGYRDGAEHAVSSGDPGALEAALPVYLAARGEPGLADAVRDAVIAVVRGRRRITATVRLAAASAARLDHDAHAADALDEALQALLHDPTGRPVKTVR